MATATIDAAQGRLTSRIHRLTVPLDPDENTGFRFYGQYRGSTKNVSVLSCHVSVLTRDHCPHPPHTHPEEEILMMLAGEADLILPAMPSSRRTFEVRMRPGQFVYYPAHFPHTLRAASREPANYLMFKWRAAGVRSGPVGLRNARLAFTRFDIADFVAGSNNTTELNFAPVFEASTRWLTKLHAHVTTLGPGAGYEPHVDAHDIAIVVLHGEIETLGSRIGPHGLVYFAAGEPHGMRNAGRQPAQYLVFEFHGLAPFWRWPLLERWTRKLASMFAMAVRT